MFAKQKRQDSSTAFSLLLATLIVFWAQMLRLSAGNCSRNMQPQETEELRWQGGNDVDTRGEQNLQGSHQRCTVPRPSSYSGHTSCTCRIAEISALAVPIRMLLFLLAVRIPCKGTGSHKKAQDDQYFTFFQRKPELKSTMHLCSSK